MITQGVEVTARCDECGGVLIQDIGQHIDQGRLWWGANGSCTVCPNFWCEQEPGDATPEVIRQALRDKHGAARLRLAEHDAGPVSVLRALCEVLRLPLGELRTMADTLTRTGLLGTWVEMEFLADGLRRRSVATTIETGLTPSGPEHISTDPADPLNGGGPPGHRHSGHRP